jgi:hypothetical protein
MTTAGAGKSSKKGSFFCRASRGTGKCHIWSGRGAAGRKLRANSSNASLEYVTPSRRAIAISGAKSSRSHTTVSPVEAEKPGARRSGSSSQHHMKKAPCMVARHSAVTKNRGSSKATMSKFIVDDADN